MSGRVWTWDAVFDGASEAVMARALAASAMIRRLHPAAVAVARPGDRAVSFGHGPAKMKESHAYLMPQPRWLNPGFHHGADPADPARLPEGSGKALCHVKLRGPGDLSAGVAALVQAAIKDQARRLG